MAKKREKLDVSQARNPLGDTPFAALLAETGKPAHKTDAGADAPARKDETVTPSRTYFTIARTKKGGLPIRLEKRAAGKSVTVISGLTGDLPQLLKHLRKLCGSGGALKADTIELQGDHREKLETFFREAR